MLVDVSMTAAACGSLGELVGPELCLVVIGSKGVSLSDEASPQEYTASDRIAIDKMAGACLTLPPWLGLILYELTQATGGTNTHD